MRRILIVDEDVHLLSSLKSALKKLHYNVIVTTACREVPDILFFFEADLIFIGISHGKEDGKGLLRQLKSRMDYQHIPVIILSAAEEDWQTAKNLGASSSLHRPFEIADLVKSVQQYI